MINDYTVFSCLPSHVVYHAYDLSYLNPKILVLIPLIVILSQTFSPPSTSTIMYVFKF